MAFNYSPKVVTDGLVLYLDAANPKSYVSGSTTWGDLSRGGNNGTLVNGPTFSSANGGSIVFDGVNDYVSFSNYSQPTYTISSSFTWNIWVFPLRNDNRDVYMGNRFGGVGTNFNKLTSNNWEYYTTIFGGAVPLNIWINITLIKNGTSLLYYRNGSLHAQTTSSIEKATQPFYIGGDPAGERSLSRISNVSVYNRALSATEVLQNYNATKTRFGL
jgi:hypothetical protein